jgi:hypothetical protein
LTVSLINQLAQSAVLSAQSAAQLELKVIGARMTAQLNTKLAALKTQSTDPTTVPLQQQVTVLNAKGGRYGAAQAQLAANASAISDVKIQLGAMAFAAANGDSAGFDQALAATSGDLNILQIVPSLQGFQPDGIARLTNAGLGVQTSSAYDLSTPAGQAQASADLASAQDVIDQAFATSSQNQSIASNIVNAVAGQVSALNSQIDDRNGSAHTAAVTAATKLQQQVETQFHLLELSMGNTQTTSTWLINTEAQLASPPTGSLFALVQSGAAGTNTTFAQAVTGATQPTAAAGSILSILT